MALMNRGGLSPRRDQVDLFARLNLGATGAITTQTKKKFSGFVVARTGVGLYTLTLDKVAARYAELLFVDAKVIIASYTAAKGRDCYVTSDLTTTTGVITIQFVQSTGASAEIDDSAIVLLKLALCLSAATVG